MNGRVFALWLALVLPLTACGGGPDPESHGVVVAVEPTRGEITLDHEDIPGLMRGMTMTFHAEPALLAGIETGQEVDFAVHAEGGRYVITAITPRR